MSTVCVRRMMWLLFGLACLTSSAALAQEEPDEEDPCATIKCGYGARCEKINGVAKCRCPTVCPLYIQEICGSDGKTYGNTCFMNIAACKNKKSITKKSNGKCPEEGHTSPPLLPTRISPGIGLPKPSKCPKKGSTGRPAAHYDAN